MASVSSIRFRPRSTPVRSPAGQKRVFLDSSDGLIKTIDDEGNVEELGGAGGSTGATTHTVENRITADHTGWKVGDLVVEKDGGRYLVRDTAQLTSPRLGYVVIKYPRIPPLPDGAIRDAVLAAWTLSGDGQDVSGNGYHLTDGATTPDYIEEFGMAAFSCAREPLVSSIGSFFSGGGASLPSGQHSFFYLAALFPEPPSFGQSAHSINGGSPCPSMWHDSSEGWEVKIYDGYAQQLTTAPLIPYGQWALIGYTVDDTAARCYVNGVKVYECLAADYGPTRWGDYDSSNAPVSFNFDSVPYSWHGLMSSMFLFSRALTEAEVLELYNDGKFYQF